VIDIRTPLDAAVYEAVARVFDDGCDTRTVARELVYALYREQARRLLADAENDRLVGLLRRTDPNRVLRPFENARAA
jgi:hypothetical protein